MKKNAFTGQREQIQQHKPHVKGKSLSDIGAGEIDARFLVEHIDLGHRVNRAVAGSIFAKGVLKSPKESAASEFFDSSSYYSLHR